MIRSDKELAVSRRKANEAEEASRQVQGAARRALERFAGELRSEVEEFEAIRSGLVNSFKVGGVDELGEALIKARIAKGWTQRQLAEELNVSEQQVQKQEARSYGGASTTRLAEVAEVLEYELEGVLRPSESEFSPQKVGSFALAVAPSVRILDHTEFDEPHHFRLQFHLIPTELVAVNLNPAVLNPGHMVLKDAEPSAVAGLFVENTRPQTNEQASCD